MHSEKTVQQKRKLFQLRIEAATRGVLLKKIFLKISQNLQGSFFIKKETLAQVFFLRILRTF